MFIRDSLQPPLSKKILECPSENCIPHPNRPFFLRGFLVTRRCAAALAFPLLLVDEKEPTIHRDRITILKKCRPMPTYTFCVVSEQSKFRSLALPQYSPRIKYGGYFSPLRGGSKSMMPPWPRGAQGKFKFPWPRELCRPQGTTGKQPPTGGFLLERLRVRVQVQVRVCVRVHVHV